MECDNDCHLTGGFDRKQGKGWVSVEHVRKLTKRDSELEEELVEAAFRPLHPISLLNLNHLQIHATF